MRDPGRHSVPVSSIVELKQRETGSCCVNLAAHRPPARRDHNSRVSGLRTLARNLPGLKRQVALRSQHRV